MPRLTTLVLGFITAILCSSILAANTQPTIQSLNKMPLAFTKNMGQWDDRVLFRANAGGATMWFTKEGVTYQFTRRIGNDNTPLNPLSRGDSLSFAGIAQNEHIPLLRGVRGVSDTSIEQLVLTAKFIGANPNPAVIAEGQMEYKCNYFLGNDPTQWHTDVPNYEAITLRDIYPGIDVKYSGDGGGQAAYEFIASPSADVSQIKVAYEGAEETSLDSDGRLTLKTKWGDMIAAIESPTSGVLSGSASFSQLSDKTVGFEADRSTPLTTGGASRQALGTLGVTLSYSTYLGGGDHDIGDAISVDGNGYAYVTGYTTSSDFPTLNPYQTHQGNYDVFVTKLSSSGNSLIYSTCLGGAGNDYGFGIAVDGSGNAYVTGVTWSSNFPTVNPYQTFQGGWDVFVTKLSSSGNSLIYSTYLGGGSDEEGMSIAVDGSGNAYVTGYTGSSNFPTLNPYQTWPGDWYHNDVFVAKLSSSGNSLIYSTYLGGGLEDEGHAIAVDGSGNAYVTGFTSSSNFPTLNPYQTYQGGYYYDVFVTKLNSSGNSLIYSTYLGGGNDDEGYGIAVDGGGNAYAMGYTYSSDFPTLSPYQTYQGPSGYSDAFVTKLSSSGNSLMYSTYLSGGGGDYGRGIAVDGSGNAYVTGYTQSSNFPTLNPYQATLQGTQDAFVTKLSSSGNSLTYSTYLGGGDWDWGISIAIDGSGNAYVTGQTGSSDFPTLNPYQMCQGCGYDSPDAFVTKLLYDVDDMGFRPNPDGWNFANIEDNMWPYSETFPTWELFRDAFGSAYTEDAYGNRLPHAEEWWKYLQKIGWRGSCFGFSLSSDMIFDKYIPSSQKPWFLPLDNAVRHMINMYQLYYIGAENLCYYNSIRNTTPTETYLQCHQMLEDNVDDDRIVTVRDSEAHHALVPWRVKTDENSERTKYIYVYDCEKPGDDLARIVLDIVTNAWSYDGFSHQYSGQRDLLISQPMSGYATRPFIPTWPPSPTEPSCAHRTTVRSVSDYVQIYFSAAAVSQLTSALGNIGNIGDSVYSTLSDGSPIIPVADKGTSVIGYFLPNTRWSCEFSGMTGAAFSLAVFTNHTVLSYSEVASKSSTAERLTYDGNDSAIWIFNPEATNKRHNSKAIMLVADSEVVCGLDNVTLSASDSIRYSATPDLGLRVDNFGRSTQYDVAVQIFSPSGDTAFHHYEVLLPLHTTHQIVPDWRSHGDSLMILKDSGMTGLFSDTSYLKNQSAYLCGDASGDAVVDISDAVYLIAYIFSGGQAPSPLLAGDANCDITVDISDAVYLIAYIFSGGAAPCAGCK